MMGSAARAEALSPQTTSRPLRAWQQAALARYEEQSPKDFLVTATPGAGKTTFALTLAARLLSRREVARVVVVARPTICACSGPTRPTPWGSCWTPGLTNAVGPVRAGTRATSPPTPRSRASRAARRPRERRQDFGHPGRGAPCRRRSLLGRGGRGGLRVQRPPGLPHRDAVPHEGRGAHPLRPVRGGQLRGRRRRGRHRPGQPRRLHLRLQGGAGRLRRPAGRLRRLHGTSRWRNTAGEVVAASLSEAGPSRWRAGVAHGAGPQGPVGAARHRRDGRPDHAPAREAACRTPPG